MLVGHDWTESDRLSKCPASKKPGTVDCLFCIGDPGENHPYPAVAVGQGGQHPQGLPQQEPC